MRKPRLAVTLGDPRGIGPEVATRALEMDDPLDAEVVLVGPGDLPGLDRFRLRSVGNWEPGGGDRLAGQLSAAAIEEAVELVIRREVDALVTAPVAKPALAAAGFDWPGHTEMLRDLVGVPETALCLAGEQTAAGGPLRVVLVTGHMALRAVPDAFTVRRLSSVARLTYRGLVEWWDLERPRLAVCALNPHASDQGLFGDEEERVCAPAIETLRSEGIQVEGPYPADTVFLRAMAGEADAVLAPYHDLGMTAIKTACFGEAVNVTLGLPFPRTSPDHGTAFDIAGTGRADPRSMRAALELAIRFSRRALTGSSSPDRFSSE